MNILEQQPVAVGTALDALIKAVLVLLVAFGMNLTPNQIASILGVETALVAVFMLLVVKARVTPNATLEAMKPPNVPEPQ